MRTTEKSSSRSPTMLPQEIGSFSAGMTALPTTVTITPNIRKTLINIYASPRAHINHMITNVEFAAADHSAHNALRRSRIRPPHFPCIRRRPSPIRVQSSILRRFRLNASEKEFENVLIFLPQYPFAVPQSSEMVRNKYPILRTPVCSRRAIRPNEKTAPIAILLC